MIIKKKNEQEKKANLKTDLHLYQFHHRILCMHLEMYI